MAKNPAAVALGRLGRGVPKTMSDAAKEQRRRAGFKPKAGKSKPVELAVSAN